MKKVSIKGTIIPNEDKWIYDYFEIDSVCPKDVEKALNDAAGEEVTVEINSGGGDVFSGNEMYYMLSTYTGNVTVDIVGFAGSAATIVACGGNKVRAIATAMYMIHNVSGGAHGDYHSMEQQSKILQTANKSVSNAYRIKTGMSQEELLKTMDNETWMDAETAKEKGFIDEIINMNNSTEYKAPKALYNTCFANVLCRETIEKIRNTIKGSNLKNEKDRAFSDAKIKYLELKGSMKNEI